MNPMNSTNPRRLVLPLLSFGLMITATVCVAKPPNFVITIADDHGVHHSSVYGSPEFQTPHLQSMADEGIRFDNAYVASPACAPSRAALFTGRMPYSNGIVGNHEHELKPGVISLLPSLLEQGYEIVFHGKVGHAGRKHFGPYVPDGVKILGGGGLQQTMTLDQVESFLESRPTDAPPLALLLGWTDTHTAWPPKEEARIAPEDVVIPPKIFDTPETRVEMTRYVEGAEDIDRRVGQTRELIAKHLDPDNTLVVYTSDHGMPWPFAKWSLYETGIRTPLIAVWPGKIKASSSTDAMVSWIDLIPTLIDLAGGKSPAGIDGRSFAKVLLGETDEHRDVIYATHKGDNDKNVYPIRSVRVGDWKYIRNLHPEFAYTTHTDVWATEVPRLDEHWAHAGHHWQSYIEAAKTDPAAAAFLHDYHSSPAEELYQIDKDPFEQNNLAALPQHADKLAELRAMVSKRMQEVGDDEALSGPPRLLNDFPLPPDPLASRAIEKPDASRDDLVVWHPMSLSFNGPKASETDDAPNPFLDYRLQVQFAGPSGQTYNLPGFFAGDGSGGEVGNQWQVRFTPDEPGRWTYHASLRSGKDVAVSIEPDAGEPVDLAGDVGTMAVKPRDATAPGFLKWGRLEYVGGHYLKFRDGPYWIRGGTDSPENFLAYAGFDNTPPSHRYADHRVDWQAGDPDWNNGDGKAIIGALNSLANQQVNSLYFLTMNIGGDGGDVWPWSGKPHRKGSPQNDNLHFDLSKLRQWEIVFDHAQRLGINLHFVFSEAEVANKKELDNGELGVERKLYYREMIARFGHHNALSWNLCEEYNVGLDLGPDRIRAFADYIHALDPYDHPITVHSAHDPLAALKFTFGDPRFSLTSIQLNRRRIDELVEEFRSATAKAGRPLPISMDEFVLDVGQKESWKPFDRPEIHRKQKIWPTLLSGGQIEFILEDLLGTDSFKTPARIELWRILAIARTFMQQNLPYWEMQPADELVTGESTIKVGLGSGKSFALGAQVFRKPGAIYAIYYPNAHETGTIDLHESTGDFRGRWFNPRDGRFEGQVFPIQAGDEQSVPGPTGDTDQDWVLLLDSKPTFEP
ncbi:MAG: sulfatase-like hydrolase/transferase [Rubripirellula sp.]